MDYESLKIKEYQHWTLFLHSNQYYLGRMYAWAKRNNLVDLMEMNAQEKSDLFLVGNEMKQALTSLFKPDMMNYAALGNISNHLHMHFIPRYKSEREFEGIRFKDERWGKNYAPYDYGFKISELGLIKIRNAIKEKVC